VAIVPQVPSAVKDAQAALGEENVGAINPPDISDTAVIKNGVIGGPGQSLVVSKNCKHPEEAVKFLSFLNSKAEVLKLNEFQVKVPIRKDVTPADLKMAPGSIGEKLFQWSGNYIFWVDNSLSGPVVDVFSKNLPLVLTGKMTPEELVAMLDKAKSQ
jgi:raffinose/stachyose/melibiose transport system substrate-binding protein